MTTIHYEVGRGRVTDVGPPGDHTMWVGGGRGLDLCPPRDQTILVGVGGRADENRTLVIY